jgi:hypothetical protein
MFREHSLLGEVGALLTESRVNVAPACVLTAEIHRAEAGDTIEVSPVHPKRPVSARRNVLSRVYTAYSRLQISSPIAKREEVRRVPQVKDAQEFTKEMIREWMEATAMVGVIIYTLETGEWVRKAKGGWGAEFETGGPAIMYHSPFLPSVKCELS